MSNEPVVGESNAGLYSQLARIHWFLPFMRGKVLDCACQYGGTTKIIAKLPAVVSVLAVDLSDQAINGAKETIKAVGIPDGKVEFLKADITTLKLDETFDTICLFCFLEHTLEEEKIIQNCVSMLNKRGNLLIAVPFENMVPPPLHGHVRTYNMTEMHQLMRKFQTKEDSFWVSVVSYRMDEPAPQWILAQFTKGVPEQTNPDYRSYKPFYEEEIIF
jgi:2-polyprenyl-3-methyl-5-hydroxy-6-metoxy-1,4-benzoquinol methylase